MTVNRLCVGGAGQASFKSGTSDAIVASCNGGETVTMQLYCMKPQPCTLDLALLGGTCRQDLLCRPLRF